MNDEIAMAARYRERLQLLAHVLYHHDPFLMGSLVGTPEDEYVPIAGRLMSPLSRAISREECARILAEHDMREDCLVDDVWSVFAELAVVHDPPSHPPWYSVNDVRFPGMRNEIVRAVMALADPDYQWSAWVRHELPPGHYDEFTHRIHILYDDTRVLENPADTLGVYLRSDREVDAMTSLADALDALFAESGTELSDEEYLRAPGWTAVIARAQAALRVVEDDSDE